MKARNSAMPVKSAKFAVFKYENFSHLKTDNLSILTAKTASSANCSQIARCHRMTVKTATIADMGKLSDLQIRQIIGYEQTSQIGNL
jgi:hypothetical protein